jgi:glycosyltransferase involved in cell wall biosynthesis
MNVLVFAHHSYPHIGGVEKHIHEISKILKKKGYKIKIVTENEINYPHIKFIGLIYIWYWLIKNINLIEKSDVVQIHDVFIWYLPFRFLFFRKPVFTTIHGYEPSKPFSWFSSLQKRIAISLSCGSIGVGEYLEKYLGVKFNQIIYGGVNKNKFVYKKDKKTILWVGRLEEDTGLKSFLKWLDSNPGYIVDFCGNGSLSKQCKKYGTVRGFCNPIPYYKKAETCIPGGYLSFLEATTYGCKIKIFADSLLRKEYWRGIEKMKKILSWKEIAQIYENQYLHYRT